MSMWQRLRKEYTNYTLEDIGKMHKGESKQYISKYENGKIKMPVDLQIMYLGFRNNESDKIIINYLKQIDKK